LKSKAIPCLALITLTVVAACAQPQVEGDLFCPENHFEVRIINDGVAVEITGYVGGRTDVRIPPYILGLPVTVIGGYAFRDGEYMKVAEGMYIWFPGHQITSVTIPNSVTHIGFGAFMSNQLTSVIIGNNIINIGVGAFAFNKLTNITIPNGVTDIGASAFMRNQFISVTIPNSVTDIGDWAFSDNQLTSIVIGNSVTHIGMWAFASNYLTEVAIPNNNAYVHEEAFDPGVTIIRN